MYTVCVYGPLKLLKNNLWQSKTSKQIFAHKPGPLCTPTAGEADWETVALEVVRGTCGQAGPCGELGEEAGWAGPRSETPAWADWFAGAGTGAACAGCGSGSCVEAEEAQRSGGMARERTRGSCLHQFSGMWQGIWLLIKREDINDSCVLFRCPRKTINGYYYSHQSFYCNLSKCLSTTHLFHRTEYTVHDA